MHNLQRVRFHPLSFSAVLLILNLPAALAGTPPPSTTDERIQALEQKILILERKLEIAEEDTTKRKSESPVITANEKGFSLTSPDQNFQLKIRGHVQADGRFVANDEADTFSDTFLLRRVRPIFEGTLFKYYSFRLMPDFGNGQTVLQDAWLEANWLPEFGIRAGKFKSPVGLERLQSATDLRFIERALPVNLVPNRDIGLQFQGKLFDGLLDYAVGYFNGVADGGSTDNDFNDDKEFAGRLFAQPFRNVFGPFQNLGLGIAGTYGEKSGTGDLGRFRTQAQQTFFSYRGTALADGTHYRLAPQAYWYWKSLGLLGEYVRSVSAVELGTARDQLVHEAWQIAGSWLITGEEASYKGVIPATPFDPWHGGYGAWELVARYGELDVDDDSFPVFANPDTAASEARAWGAGVNWWLNKNFKVAANYEHTRFAGGAAGGLDRPTEHAFLTRLQIAY